ncbi:MAG: Ig-like domain-containing protein [Nitrospirota bacterium]
MARVAVIGRRALMAVVWAVGVSFVAVDMTWAADGSVAIVSPKPNEVVGSDVTVTWTQEKAGRADHVHVFVDRGQMKPVKTGTSTVIKGLPKGTHEITVQAYSSDHEPLDAKASVTVKVE